jgi:hypothetical protein
MALVSEAQDFGAIGMTKERACGEGLPITSEVVGFGSPREEAV